MKLRKVHIGPIGNVVLGSIAISGAIAVAVLAPNAFQILKPFLKKKKYSPHRAIRKSIESLIASGLVKYTKDAQGNLMLELTQKGKWESSIRNLSLPTLKKRKWDRMWRIVIFDVPNTHTKLRDELRRGMKLYGFKLLQRSVWVYPYKCDDFIKILKDHLEVSKSVLYVTAQEIEDDSLLRKSFKL